MRHQGFIPWDDDHDISMYRGDYMRFLEIAPGELPAGWHVHSIYDNNVGFNIYPLDVLAPSDKEDKNICELLKILVYTVQLCTDQAMQVQELLMEIEGLCNVRLNPSGDIINQLMRLADHPPV